MNEFNTAPLTEVSTDWFRSHLREALDRVQMRGARYQILRHGQPVAGVVPLHEAQALLTVAKNTHAYREWLAKSRLDAERRLRDAVREEGMRRP
ncbi:hypothetical protein VK792_15100 [Mesobacterium sp. TK19101]|uniref:Antitoxin n=1 Tax=Mesobacterium hydrothermale TaxID=3111907 RepID=A0ABU6HKH4_9RHOB|nr:hypothetical protein [Mesobacterium sp. TK19101]MEC3862617.1 hypothetical protein [Mesobacterium sp. TK19101]